MHPIPIDFNCQKCGVECSTAPDLPKLPICENCCEDHNYEYESFLRQHVCIHCGKKQPED